MQYTKEQLEKLPKWASSEITSLNYRIKELEKYISQINGESETNTYITEGLSKRPLQKNATVEFQTGVNNLNKVSVYVRNDGTIDINTDSRLGESMVILPRAANSFYITFINQ
jgi:hypothetical protein